MKIMTAAELWAMPAGTIYARCVLCITHGWCVKGDNMGDADSPCWSQCPIIEFKHDSSNEFADNFFAMWDDGASFPIQLDFYGREDTWDKDVRYMVLEYEDQFELMRNLVEMTKLREMS